MEHYDIDGIRQNARALQSALGDFTSDCKRCDQLISELNSSWDDDAYKAFAAKYNEYTGTMKNMQDCLQNYIEFLNKAAGAVEHVVVEAANAAR